jgi:hypothetical protein
VRFLRHTARLDPSQILVMGHSMGGRAALAYASHHDEVAGLMTLAGSSDILGPRRVPNALFLYAERELDGIERSMRIVAAGLAGVGEAEPGKTYGDFASGTAVRLRRIAGANHGGLISAPDAFAEVIAWADAVTRRSPRAEPARFVSRPAGSSLPWLAFLLALPGLGMVLGRLAPTTGASADGRATDLALLSLSLLLSLVLVAEGRPGLLLGLGDADVNVTHLALTGFLLTAALAISGRLGGAPQRLPAACGVAVLAWLAVWALLAPVSAGFHGVGLTPEKAALALWTAALLAPLAYALQRLSSRQSWWRGALLRLAGRVTVLVMVGAGNVLGVFGFAGNIAIFVLLAALLMVEPLFAGFYARSDDKVTAAGMDALISGWLFALYLPASV